MFHLEHPPDNPSPRQQRRIPPRRRGVHGDGLLGAEAVQVVRAAGLGAGAGEAFAAEGLHADHGTDLIAVDGRVCPIDPEEIETRNTASTTYDETIAGSPSPTNHIAMYCQNGGAKLPWQHHSVSEAGAPGQQL